MAAALRAIHLGSQSLWVDEVFTAWSAGVGERLSWTLLRENVHGPLHAVLVHLSTAWFGPSEWAMRLPSAVAGVLAVPALAALATRWLGRETAPWAAWLAALSPFLVWYGQEARNYALALLFSVLAVDALLSLGDRFRPLDLLRLAVTTAAALLTNLGFILLVPFLLRLALAPGGARAARRRGVLVLAVLGLLVLLPWLPQITRTWDWSRLAPDRAPVAGEPALRAGTTFHPAAVPFALHAFAVGYTLGPSLRELRSGSPAAAVRRHGLELALVALIWGSLAVLGVRALVRRRRLLDAALWFVAPMLAVSYFALQNFKVFHPRYLMVAYPAWLLAAAAGLADARPRWRAGLAVGVLALWGTSLVQHYVDPAMAKEDYRGSMAMLRGAWRPGEVVLAAGSEPPVQWYAGGEHRVESFWLGYAADTMRMQARARDRFARAPGTWVVASRTSDLDPEDRFAGWLDREHPGSRVWNSGGVRVWHIGSAETADTATGAVGRR